MGLLKFILKVFNRPLLAEAYYKIRFNLNVIWNPFKLFLLPKENIAILKNGDHIVIIGAGIGAHSFLDALKKRNYQNVTVVTKEDGFGGKCVNLGCMPSEFFWAKRADVKSGTKSLRNLTEQSFRSFGYPILNAEVERISRKEIFFKSGESLKFDHLVVATGNKIVPPSYLGEVLPLERFWSLKAGNLVIVAGTNPAALSYADMASEMGLRTIVVFEDSVALGHLPSFNYFQKEIEKRGVRVVSKAKIAARKGNVLEIKYLGETEELFFDELFYCGAPSINVPAIDKREITVLDIDFRSGRLRGRNDISFIGDASGLLSATEAELQGRKHVDLLLDGKLFEVDALERLPFRLHANQSFGAVGPVWSLFETQWSSIDFLKLGWSAVHQLPGKLWYLYDKKKKKVLAIHICHRDASDLISMSAALIDRPIDDISWVASSVHPSSFEIFKVLATQAEGLKSAEVLSEERDKVIRLPPASQALTSIFYNAHFTEEERVLGAIDQDPDLYFGVLLGFKSILRSRGGSEGTSFPLRRTSENRYATMAGEPISYVFRPEEDLITVTFENQSANIAIRSK